MRLLLDTCVFLEVLLEQKRAEEAKSLLSMADEQDFYISDYAFHSIGLSLFRRGQYDVFRQFVEDMFMRAGLCLARLSARDMEAVIQAAQAFKLDFDDAYQYVVAEKHGLTLISLDNDFDHTERGRKTPSEILALLP